MADMCGPSNALQSFQKHTTVDRTLQQDRLISRQSPSTGFRSTAPNARHLDPEFEAFQAGLLPLDQTFQPTAQHFQPQSFQPGPSNWASDFQRLNISRPFPTQSNIESQIQQKQNGAWHHDFSRQQGQLGNPSSLQSQPQSQFGITQGQPMSGMGMQSPGNYAYPMESSQMNYGTGQQEGVMDRFDDAAFEAAFDAAAKEAEMETVQADSVNSTLQDQSTNSGEQISSITLDTAVQEQTLDEAVLSAPPIQNDTIQQPLIGADTIHDPSKSEVEQQSQDPDALARTAQRLIDSLSGDTGQKLQESEFMKLMRGFAGGQKVIVGEEVVAR